MRYGLIYSLHIIIGMLYLPLSFALLCYYDVVSYWGSLLLTHLIIVLRTPRHARGIQRGAWIYDILPIVHMFNGGRICSWSALTWTRKGLVQSSAASSSVALFIFSSSMKPAQSCILEMSTCRKCVLLCMHALVHTRASEMHSSGRCMLLGTQVRASQCTPLGTLLGTLSQVNLTLLLHSIVPLF